MHCSRVLVIPNAIAEDPSFKKKHEPTADEVSNKKCTAYKETLTVLSAIITSVSIRNHHAPCLLFHSRRRKRHKRPDFWHAEVGHSPRKSHETFVKVEVEPFNGSRMTARVNTSADDRDESVHRVYYIWRKKRETKQNLLPFTKEFYPNFLSVNRDARLAEAFLG